MVNLTLINRKILISFVQKWYSQ